VVDARFANLEHELCRIPEVTAARIVMNDEGRPAEVHILASPEKHAKQVVRDIQSVAMASFGLDLDRRLISVVQLEGDKSNGSGERRGDGVEASAAAVLEGPRPLARPPEDDDRDRVVVEGVVTLRSGVTAVAEVALQQGEERVTGRAEGTVASSAILRVVAQATLDGLRQLEPAALRVDVETATVVRVGDRSIALATIVVMNPPYEEVMAGAAVVRAAGDHDAVARAVLHAVNRRLGQLP
jgi:hypothetical protein